MNRTQVKYLLIEGDPSDAEMLLTCLKLSERAIFHAIWKTNLGDALDYLKQQTPDVILCDLYLVDSHGPETFRAIFQKTPETPIVVLTRVDNNEMANEVVHEGAEDYILKSNDFDTTSLERALLYAIERKHKEIELKHKEADLKRINRELQISLDAQTMLNDRLLQTASELNGAQEQLKFDMTQARIAQRVLLPNMERQFPGIRLTSKYVPLEQVGGDLYDIVKLSEDRLGILIADATGHGISAALITFLFSGLFKTYAPEIKSPSQLLKTLDEVLYNKIPDTVFVTAAYCIYDNQDKTLTYSSAGHPPGFLIHAQNQEVVALGSTSILLGGFKEHALGKDITHRFALGDKAILYTDGLTEARGPKNKPFGSQRVQNCLLKHAKLPIDQLLEASYSEVLKFSQLPNFKDDLTLIGLQGID